MRLPVFWPTSETTCSIQTHSIPHRHIVAKLDGARRIAYSVAGTGLLDVFEINRTFAWVSRELPKLIPGSKPVEGGQWDDFWVKELATAKGEETAS